MEKITDSKWVAKYPFDPYSKHYLRKVAFDIEEYFSRDLIHVIEYSFSRALSILHGPKYTWENDDLEAVSYFIATLIVRGTDNRHIYYMYADVESKRAYKILLREDESNIVALADHMNIPLKYDYEEDRFYLPFVYYLRFANRFLSPHWRIYYHKVLNGYVYVEKRKAVRILSEVAKDFFIEDIERIAIVPDKIKEYSDKLLIKLSSIIKKIERSNSMIKYTKTKEIELYPPCIKWMIDNINSGLPHMARFTLVTFLLKMGYTIEEIVNIFSMTPDFNPERTRYQVEHISGLRGSRKVYAVPSCRTLKSYSLCFPNKMCNRISHPLQYTSRVREIENIR